MKTLVLASNNAGKLAELNRLLAPMNFNVQAQSAHHVPDCDEPFFTFVENALHKARHAARHTGLPALADDSGICVPALNGAPGVHSARFAGDRNDASNNAKLIEQLRQHSDKRAYFYCVLVLVRHADDPQPLIVDGLWWGEVLDAPQGEGGFGYDPHFYVPELGCSAAQLSHEHKNQISHRGQAVQKLLARLGEV
ncbi:MAG: RdgB/HAM1 family non-canonical purine NTP pyrophosphatase [Formosimonas sp.]